MRLASVIALAAVATTLAAIASPADAQRRIYRGDRSERITIIDENGRARTRITVRPRSYLDGGTEVFPGERKFTEYAYPHTYMNGSAMAAFDPAGTFRSPLPMPYQLPYYNPYLPY